MNIEIDQLNEKRLLDNESLGCRVGKKNLWPSDVAKNHKLAFFVYTVVWKIEMARNLLGRISS